MLPRHVLAGSTVRRGHVTASLDEARNAGSTLRDKVRATRRPRTHKPSIQAGSRGHLLGSEWVGKTCRLLRSSNGWPRAEEEEEAAGKPASSLPLAGFLDCPCCQRLLILGSRSGLRSTSIQPTTAP